jgi:hypothetical protein
MSPEFQKNIASITAWLAGRTVEPGLVADLDARFPPSSQEFKALAAACRAGMAEGWLGQRGEPALRWGRPVKPGPESCGYSVDVVEMTEIAGPHHAHPQGEIDMIIPVDADARFDGHGVGWLVYAPGSAHAPTVTGGKAIVLYLLPAGEISFTQTA